MTFDGWYTGKTGDIKVTTDTVFTSNTTIYARWNVNYVIEVTLNGYESGKKVADTTLTENSDSLDIDLENCHIFTEKDGEPDWASEVTEFEANKDYWLVIALTKQGGDALAYSDLSADDVDLTNDHTAELLIYDDDLWWVSYKLKPLADSAPTEYTVYFDANGGTGMVAPETVISGEYELPACAFTAPDGKQFKAWSVGGEEKAVGDKITVTADTTVTAVWENIPASHTCDIKPVAKDEPSCTKGGKEAYYKCEDCGKFFEDALGTKEIADLENWGNLPKLDHTESDWKSDKDNHWKECTAADCGVIIENSKAAHKDENADGKCDVCEYNVGTPTTPDGDEPNDNPQTGDNGMIRLCIALLFVGGTGVVTATYGKKRFFAK